MPQQACTCGHGREAHEHYRPGSDCALCPPGTCDRFRAARGGSRSEPRLHSRPPRSAPGAE